MVWFFSSCVLSHSYSSYGVERPKIPIHVFRKTRSIAAQEVCTQRYSTECILVAHWLTYKLSPELKPFEPDPFRVSTSTHTQNNPYPMNRTRPFHTNSKTALRMQTEEQTADVSNAGPDSPAGEVYGLSGPSTSAIMLLDRLTQSTASPSSSMYIHQPSNGEIAQNSVYTTAISGSRDEVPPPYQSLLTTSLGYFTNRVMGRRDRHISL